MSLFSEELTLFAIVLDSTSATPTPRLKEQGVSVVPLTVRFGEEEYIDGETMLPEEFFRRMAEYLPQGLPKTSCPAPGKFEQAFRAAAEGCEGVICITLSSGVSDTHHSACMAADICAQDGIKVEVIDSLAVQEGNSLMCEKAIRMRDAGATLEETAAHMRRMAQEIQTIVALNQLDNLVKGGRIGKAAGVAAGLLNLKPILALDKPDGVIETVTKSRGVKGLLKDCAAYVKSIEEKQGPCEVRFSHSNALERVEAFKAAFDAAGVAYNPEPSWMGPVIGTYTGENAVVITTCPKELL